MQNSELFRRGAVVPLDLDALLALRAWDVSESTPVTVALLEAEDDFSWLWTRGFFGRINAVTGATLDDYEEDEIAAEYAGRVLKVVGQFQALRDVPAGIRVFLTVLAAVCAASEHLGMPIFFIL